jgi:hypothetical protein
LLAITDHKPSKYKVYHARIEDVELDSLHKEVDYIFSEFMGYFLLHEYML